MVFSSLPSSVDPPHWPQQHLQQPAGGLIGDGSGGDHEICQLPPPLLPPPPPLGNGGDGRSLQILEPGRMTQRDTAMKCPRCESTNTKFCYFNNYSLSQPRHFCKTCRRYWTRGGALRNVPVGGGCRRNKKSNKGSRVSRSKSPSATISSITSNAPTDVLGHLSHNTQSTHFPILPPLHHFGGGDLGLTYGGGNGTDLFKFSHFPTMEGSNGGMYGEGPSSYSSQVGGMKMEETHPQQQHQEMNFSRNFLGISRNDQFLGTSNVAWGTTDLSGFTSTSTTHLL